MQLIDQGFTSGHNPSWAIIKIKKFKLIDTQGTGVFSDELFDTKEEAPQRLIGYHQVDWTGENPIEEMSLNFLLEHGQFEIEEV